MKSRMILVSLVALLLLAGLAWAQVSPGHDLSWHVLSGGGREGMSSGAHSVDGTLGQLAIGPSASTSHQAGLGYWYGVGGGAGPPPLARRAFLPVVER